VIYSFLIHSWSLHALSNWVFNISLVLIVTHIVDAEERIWAGNVLLACVLTPFYYHFLDGGLTFLLSEMPMENNIEKCLRSS
jgi:hypothetical protein